MSLTTMSASWPTTPATSLSPVSLLPSSAPMRDIEADIREFWGSFPCPPPWKPRLLVEVNASRLAPHVSKTLQSFLAGKCDIEYVLAGFDIDPDLEDQNQGSVVDLHSTGSPDPGSSLGSPATSEQQWCDLTCEVAIGCAIFFVIVAMVVAVLVCVTRHRVRHKMASTRPSRQQLQLSTSTSDAANCTEFSNLEVQGDDDLTYPPFRHRGLPMPPSACHPSCDSKWNCPNCASCHPLMRMSPPDQYYSRAYSAVYETIDDDDDDTQRGGNENCPQSRGITPVKNDPRNPYHGCIPCPMSPTGHSSVQFRPIQHNGIGVRDSQQMAETGFNGDEAAENAPRSALPPKYFELEHTCALSGHHLHNALPHSQNLPNVSALTTSSGDCFNIAFSNPGQQQPLVTFSPCHYPNLAGTPLHSFIMSQAQHNALPCADELYKVKTASEAAPRGNHDMTNREESGASSNQLVHSYHRNSEQIAISPFHDGRYNYTDHGPTVHNIHHTRGGRGICHVSHASNPAHVCAATSSFLADAPDHYYCSSCLQNNAVQLTNPQREMATSYQVMEDPQFRDSAVGPDLLNEASNHAEIAEQGNATLSSPDDLNDENNEVPLRKPVLALHSHYFAKTSAA